MLMSESELTPEVVMKAARAAHDVNRAYCIALGDNSQPEWDAAPQWHRSSMHLGVISVAQGKGPAVRHGEWMSLKTAEGWTYGPTKDVEKKTHPCMVPYDALPVAQRQKDAIFGAVVTGVLSHESEKLRAAVSTGTPSSDGRQ